MKGRRWRGDCVHTTRLGVLPIQIDKLFKPGPQPISSTERLLKSIDGCDSKYLLKTMDAS